MTASPVCEECASSTITANLDPDSSVAVRATTGNFCNVVTMMRACLPSNAAFRSAEVLPSPIAAIMPGGWSNPATVSCS